MQDAFSAADSLLLKPYGLDEAALEATLARMRHHAIDYADLYFQYTRSEAWSLEEGIVKSGSFSIDQGVGVRAVAGDKTAFAYSDAISLEALSRSADAVRAIGQAGGDGSAGAQTLRAPKPLYPALGPCHSLEAAAKVALLEKWSGWPAP